MGCPKSNKHVKVGSYFALIRRSGSHHKLASCRLGCDVTIICRGWQNWFWGVKPGEPISTLTAVIRDYRLWLRDPDVHDRIGHLHQHLPPDHLHCMSQQTLLRLKLWMISQLHIHEAIQERYIVSFIKLKNQFNRVCSNPFAFFPLAKHW